MTLAIELDERPGLELVDARRNLAKLVTRLLELWKLPTGEQLDLLGLSETSRSLLSRYRKREPLSAGRDVLDRVGWLMAIHKALRLL